MYFTRHYIAVTCDTAGDCTAYSSELCNGHIRAVRYVIDSSTPIKSTATITITAEASGLAVLAITTSSSNRSLYPVSPVNMSSDGAIAYYTTAANSVESQTAQIPIAQERLKVVVDGGGTGVTGGGIYAYVG